MIIFINPITMEAEEAPNPQISGKKKIRGPYKKKTERRLVGCPWAELIKKEQIERGETT